MYLLFMCLTGITEFATVKTNFVTDFQWLISRWMLLYTKTNITAKTYGPTWRLFVQFRNIWAFHRNDIMQVGIFFLRKYLIDLVFVSFVIVPTKKKGYALVWPHSLWKYINTPPTKSLRTHAQVRNPW